MKGFTSLWKQTSVLSTVFQKTQRVFWFRGSDTMVYISTVLSQWTNKTLWDDTMKLGFKPHVGAEEQQDNREAPLGVGFVSCHYKLPQTSCHERTRIYSFTVLETTSPKSFHWAKLRVWAGMAPSGGSEGKSTSLPFPASGGCLHASAHDFFPLSLQSLAFIITSPTSSFDLLGSCIQGPLWLHLGPIQIMQDNLLISRSLTQLYL